MKNFLIQTYLFWTVFSFCNFNFFFVFIFPPLIFVGNNIYTKFIPFILPSFIFSVVVTIIFFYVFNMFKILNKYKKIFPILLNFIFLFFFICSSTIYRNILIQDELIKYNVKYAFVNSFITSLKIAGKEWQFDSHAAFYKDDNLYLWSFRDMNFYLCPRSVMNNISISSRKLYRKR